MCDSVVSTSSAEPTVPDGAALLSHKSKELSWFSASLFIVGTMAGAGILALPKAMQNASWYGIALIIICCLCTSASCRILSTCWIIVEEQWPELKENVRDPFPTIGTKAYGPWMGMICAFTMDLQLFGTAAVFLLLSSELTARLIQSALTPCELLLVIAFVLCPLTWLKSPKHFKPIGFLATACTLVSCILIDVMLLMMASHRAKQPTFAKFTWSSFPLSFSTVMFAFGGICTLPTIQNDMKAKEKFTNSVTTAFAILIALYLPLAVGSYAVFGEFVQDNILDNIHNGHITFTVNLLLNLHLFCAILIVINPLNCDLEQRCGIQHSFNPMRVVLRTTVVALVLFVSLSVPKFSKILNLSGAAIIPVQTFIMPPLFYYKLSKRFNEPDRYKISKAMKLYLIMVVPLGIIAIVLSTYIASKDLIESTAFVRPCYL